MKLRTATVRRNYSPMLTSADVRGPCHSYADLEKCQQHKQIHDGLDRYDAAIADFRRSPSTYSPDKLRSVMDSFKTVLFLRAFCSITPALRPQTWTRRSRCSAPTQYDSTTASTSACSASMLTI